MASKRKSVAKKIVPPARKDAKWLCIRECHPLLMVNGKRCVGDFKPGDIYEGDRPPAPRHFVEYKGKNLIKELRKRIEDAGFDWYPKWDLEMLRDMADAAEKNKVQREQLAKGLKAQGYGK